jgi:large subunit ribosomal protein L30
VADRKKTAEGGKIAITQVRSTSGRPEKHRRTLRALGFTRNQQTRIHEDTPAIRGMIGQVSHLVEVRDVEE